jgi:hypothetical protein
VPHVTEEAFYICLYNVPIAPELEFGGEISDRILRTPFVSISITAIQKVLLIDGIQDFCTRRLNELVFQSGDG